MTIESVMLSNHLILCHPFSFCLQSFPASGSFPMDQLFSSGSQSIGVSASVLPVSIEDWFPLGLTGWISLQSKGLSTVFQHHRWKASILQHSAFFMVQLSHSYIITEKTIGLTRQTFVGKVMSLLFNTLSRFVRAFLPSSKSLPRPFPKRMRPGHPQVQAVGLSRAWRKNGFASTGGYFELISPQVTRNDSSSWFYTRASHTESSHLRGGRREPHEKKKNSWMLVSSDLSGAAWGDFSSSGVPLCFLTLSFWAGVPGHRSYHRDCQLYFYFPIVKKKKKKKTKPKKKPFSIIFQLLLRAQVSSLSSLLTVLLWHF